MSEDLSELSHKVVDKKGFKSTNDYLMFSLDALEYIEKNKQAKIVSQNENIYCFYQYNEEGNYKITRPFNSKLLYSPADYGKKVEQFIVEMEELKKNGEKIEKQNRELINRVIYTSQQCVGFILDSTGGNQARKLAGDHFEKLMIAFFNDIGFNCKNGTCQVPVKVDNKEMCKMQYQHDLVFEDNNTKEVKLIGSVKTTSKDRIDKIFIDKFIYSKLTETQLPHIAIFLHDVQRKNTTDPTKYGISSTFLPGHFKGYTIKLNPLDGVYYFDIRPNMLSDELLKEQIRPFDALVYDDIWNFI